MNRIQRKQKRLSRNGQRNSDPALLLRPVFPGQFVTTIKLHGSIANYNTTVTSGVIAVSLVIDPVNDIVNWATRFGVTFDEYRVIKAVCQIRCFATINPGVLVLWVDENTNSTPTSTQAQEWQGSTIFPASDVNKVHSIKWTPHSTDDQAYSPLATVATTAWFKLYTAASSFGSSQIATNYCSSQIMYTIQFRGLP